MGQHADPVEYEVGRVLIELLHQKAHGQGGEENSRNENKDEVGQMARETYMVCTSPSPSRLCLSRHWMGVAKVMLAGQNTGDVGDGVIAKVAHLVKKISSTLDVYNI